MGSLNEIELIADRAERIRQYHAVVAADARHHRAWNNLAVDLLAAGRWIEARRAALMVRAIDPSLGSASPPCKQLLAVGSYRLESELVATATHVVYRASGPEGAVLIRALLDCDARAAARLYGEHELLLRHDAVDGVAKAMSSVRAADGTLFQVLADAAGRTLHERIVGGLISPSDGLTAIDRVAEVVTRARAAGIESIELRPEYILVEGGAVTLLGPLSWRGDEAWRAPEERAGQPLSGEAGDVYRLGLLVAVAVTGQAPPTLGADGQRKLPRLPPGEVRAAELLTRSLAVDPAARPSLETWRAALTAARGVAPTPDAALRRIGDYALVRELGRGRLANVYEAVTASGDRCAVKVLHPAAAADPELRRRFLAEARAVNDVDHPGIIKVITHGQDLDEHYVVMELAQGGSLADRLSASGALTAAEASDLGAQVASAMQAVHTPTVDGRHLVHRDLKPGNILYRKPGQSEVAVSDFGVAKLYGEPTEHGVAVTSSGRPLGTPAYMAPEQWMMLDDIDARADIYALGAVLYESLTGRAPFTGRNDYELQQAHLAGEPPPLAAAGVPPRLAAIVHKMLARDRDQRFASMSEVADALQSWPALAAADAKAAAEAATAAEAKESAARAEAERVAAEQAAAEKAAAEKAAAEKAAADKVAAEQAAAEKAAADKAAADKVAAEKAAAEKAAAEKAAAEKAAAEKAAAEKAAAEKAAAEKAAAAEMAAKEAAAQEAAREKAAREEAAREEAAREAAAREEAARDAVENQADRSRRRRYVLFGGIVLAGAGIATAVVLAGGSRGPGRVQATLTDGREAIDAPVDAAVDAPVDGPDVEPRPRVHDQPRILNVRNPPVLEIGALAWVGDEKLVIPFTLGTRVRPADFRARLVHLIDVNTGEVLDATRHGAAPTGPGDVVAAWNGARDARPPIVGRPGPRGLRPGGENMRPLVFYREQPDRSALTVIAAEEHVDPNSGVVSFSAEMARSDEVAAFRADGLLTPAPNLDPSPTEEIQFLVTWRRRSIFEYRTSLTVQDVPASSTGARLDHFVDVRFDVYWSPSRRHVALVINESLGGKPMRAEVFLVTR